MGRLIAVADGSCRGAQFVRLRERRRALRARSDLSFQNYPFPPIPLADAQS